MTIVAAVFSLLTALGLAEGPDQITPLLVGRVVEYDNHDPGRTHRERQEWFADGTTYLENMGAFGGNLTREWQVIGRIYCSNLRESDGQDCYHVITWDNGRRIRFRPVAQGWGDYVFTLKRTYVGTFID